MNEALISDINRFLDELGVTIAETAEQVELSIARCDLSLFILIPRGALEWWVEVNVPGGQKVEDWCDYTGHDAAPQEELSEDMRADVLQFIERILARPLRIAESGRIIEWQVGGSWLKAVPFAPNE